MEIPTNLGDFYVYLGGPFVAIAIAFLADRVGSFQKLSPDAKHLIIVLVNILLGLLSYALVQYVPSSVTAELQPIWAVIAIAINASATYTISQVAHIIDKRTK